MGISIHFCQRAPYNLCFLQNRSANCIYLFFQFPDFVNMPVNFLFYWTFQGPN